MHIVLSFFSVIFCTGVLILGRRWALLMVSGLSAGIWGWGEYLIYNDSLLYSWASNFSMTLSGSLIIFLLRISNVNKRIKLLLLGIYFLVILLMVFIGLLFLIYNLYFGSSVDSGVINLILQSNPFETISFVSGVVPFSGVLLCLLITMFLLYNFYLEYRFEIRKKIIIRRINYFYFVAILLFISNFYLNNFRVTKFITSSVNSYQRELKDFKKKRFSRLDTRKIINGDMNVTRVREEETYVIIIGESLNKRHMSLYGYPRNTTPFLDKLNNDGELYVARNAFSYHTTTMRTLSKALMNSDVVNDIPFSRADSLVEILKSVGFEVHWITNQNLMGLWDNEVSIISKEAHKLTNLNHSIGKVVRSQFYDEAVLRPLDGFLNSKKKKKVVFVHLLGNHFSYSDRYPEKFMKFQGQLDKSYFGKVSNQKKIYKGVNNINHYDNSVLYNDYVVSSIISAVKKRKKIISGVLYFSDHGDDVYKQVWHSPSKFTFNMVQVPVVFWFSYQYKKMFKSRIDILKKNLIKFFSNEYIFNTVLGMIGVKLNSDYEKYNLFSENYELSKERLFTLGGDKRYDSNENKFYWQAFNFNWLRENELDSRVMVHRVNTYGKRNELSHHGIAAYELDTYLIDKKEGETLVVGHDLSALGSTLKNFLKDACKEIKKIWLDIKNINENNHNTVLKELEDINKDVCEIKNKAIIESSTTLDEFRNFVDSGWYTSYYLPTKKINHMLRKNKNGLDGLFNEIILRQDTQKYSSISFDKRFYELVKRKIEPSLKNNIFYHVWLGPSISNGGFKTELIKMKIYKDPRVKTILVPLESDYDL